MGGVADMLLPNQEELKMRRPDASNTSCFFQTKVDARTALSAANILKLLFTVVKRGIREIGAHHTELMKHLRNA